MHPRFFFASLSLCCLIAACSSGGGEAIDPLALWPFAEAVESTDLVVVTDPEQRSLLDGGWTPRADEASGVDALWVEGTEAGFRFAKLAPGAATVELECRPFAPAGTPRQVVALTINGAPVGIEYMDSRWRTYRFAVPESGLVRGWNRAQLRFDHAVSPAEAGTAEDRRHLSARCRSIRVHTEPARPPRPDQAGDASLVAAGSSGSSNPGSTALQLPTDSRYRFYVWPRGDVSMAGRLRPSLAPGAATGSVFAAIGLARDAAGSPPGREGEAVPDPFEAVFDLGDLDGREFRNTFDITPDGPLAVSLSVWGGTNATVSWRDLSLEAVGGFVAEPTELHPAPGTGNMGRPDVVVIVLDAARHDGFSTYGAPYPTPGVDALAARGTRFDRAYSTSSWTGQAIPSLLTGRYPEAHGIEAWGVALHEDIPHVAETLSEAGYATRLWSHHNVYSGNRTVARGFDSVTVYHEGDWSTLPEAAELLDPERPTLALVHLLPPHALPPDGAYAPPAPFRGMYTGWYTGDMPVNGKTLNGYHAGGPRDFDDDDLRYVWERYLENVRFADSLVARLVDSLEGSGRYEDAMIVVTSDHGEAFYEHETFLHTKLLYEEMVRVPLVVKWPAGPEGFAGEVDEPVTLADLAPTILDATSTATPATFQGRSLLPVVFEDAELDRPLYLATRGRSGLDSPARWVRAFLYGGYKLIAYGEQADAGHQLFHLDEDPAEREDLSSTRPILAGFLHQQLRRQALANEMAHPAGADQIEIIELSETERQRLRALGYIQ